jgi:hypothetical protein
MKEGIISISHKAAVLNRSRKANFTLTLDGLKMQEMKFG